MEEKTYIPMIAGIVTALASLIRLVNLINYGFHVVPFLFLAAFVFLTVALFLNRKDLRVFAATGLCIAELAALLAYVSLSNLLGLASSALLLVFALSFAYPQFENMQSNARKLWFVPAIIVFVTGMILPIFRILMNLDYFYLTDVFRTLFNLNGILTVAVFALFGLSIVDTIGSTSGTGNTDYGDSGAAPASGSSTVRNTAPVEGEFNLVAHILLLLFTFGIWQLIWIYRTTGYLNQVEDEPPRNPTTKLLLCIFVPFYGIYWTYKSAQRLDKLSVAKDISSDLTVLCLILAIFVPIIPPILMQDKINSIAVSNRPDRPAAPNVEKAAPKAEETVSGASVEPAAEEKAQTAAAPKTEERSVVEELKAYKGLLDSGVITQEEFDAKKRQLLNL